MDNINIGDAKIKDMMLVSKGIIINATIIDIIAIIAIVR